MRGAIRGGIAAPYGTSGEGNGAPPGRHSRATAWRNGAWPWVVRAYLVHAFAQHLTKCMFPFRSGHATQPSMPPAGPLSAVPPLALPPAALAADVALRSPRLPPRPGRSILSSRNFCHPGISRAKYPGPRAAQSILTPSFPPSEAQSGNPVAGNMVPTRSWIPADRAGALAGMTPDSTRPPPSADNSARRRPRVTARTAPVPAADPGNRGRGDPARIRHRRGPT